MCRCSIRVAVVDRKEVSVERRVIYGKGGGAGRVG